MSASIIKPATCNHCDLGSGQRGMDNCSKCDGTGSVFLVGVRSFPNTREGYEEALEALVTQLWEERKPRKFECGPSALSDGEFLLWVRNRLIHIHKEPIGYDYITRLGKMGAAMMKKEALMEDFVPLARGTQVEVRWPKFERPGGSEIWMPATVMTDISAEKLNVTYADKSWQTVERKHVRRVTDAQV